MLSIKAKRKMDHLTLCSALSHIAMHVNWYEMNELILVSKKLYKNLEKVYYSFYQDRRWYLSTVHANLRKTKSWFHIRDVIVDLKLNVTLPPNITKLELWYDPPPSLPFCLQKLTFGSDYDTKLPELPNSLLELHIGFNWNHLIENTLPPNLTKLTFGYYFNQQLSSLPSSLTNLTFGTCFNQELSSLPLSLTTLIFGNDFNQKIECLPPNLQILRFGSLFNHFSSKFWIAFYFIK